MYNHVHRIEGLVIAVAFALLAALLIVIVLTVSAYAQGIYIGRDGRAHPQVIVGADGGIFPVAPTFCYGGFGPCPVILEPPLPWRHPQFLPPPPPNRRLPQ